MTLGHIVTTDYLLDREDWIIFENAGIYEFEVAAREIVDDDESIAENATSTVTLVITDVDDNVPEFNEDSFTVQVSEDITSEVPLPGDDNDFV